MCTYGTCKCYSKLPNDILYWRYELLLIPCPVAIMYILKVAVMIFTTIKFILLRTQSNKGYIPVPTLAYHVCRLLSSTLLFCYVDCHSWQLCNFSSNIIILSLFASDCVYVASPCKTYFSFSSRLRSHLGKCWRKKETNIKSIAPTVQMPRCQW